MIRLSKETRQAIIGVAIAIGWALAVMATASLLPTCEPGSPHGPRLAGTFILGGCS